MEECFPDWGTYLNNQIEAYEIPKGQVGLWWIGGASWVLKTDAGGIFWIDMFSGASGYTKLASCGVCRQTGADSLNWLSLLPHVIDPWKFKRLDGCFISVGHFLRTVQYMPSFSVPCSCVCSRLTSPSVSSWHKQDNTLICQSRGRIQRRTPYSV